MFGNAEVIAADVVFRANWAEFQGDTAKIRESALSTYGALDNGSVKAALAQEKFDRALARSKGSAYAVAKATAVYKSDLAALEATQSRATSGSGRHSSALKAEERSLGGVARGALVGSGALGHLGRAAVFASSSILGGYGLVYAFRTVLSAARNQEVALGHLEVALDNSGLGWERNKTKVESSLDALVKATAFTKNELTEAVATNVRRFGDLDQALQATSAAADVARGKNISLADAVGLVTRASFGQQKSVRSLSVDVTATTSHMDALHASTKNATGEQIKNAKAADQQATRLAYLAAVQKSYYGESAKFLASDAGKQQIFNAELEHSQAIIGSALLPIFNHYLTDLSDWLDKMNRSGKLQRDVNKIVGDAKTILHDAGAATHFLSGNLGGLKGILEILVGLKVASMFHGWVGPLAKTGAAAETSAGQVGGLRGKLAGLNSLSIAPIVIPIEIQLEQKIKGEIGKHLGGTAASIYGNVEGFVTGIGGNPIANEIVSLFGHHGKKKPDHSDHRLRRGSVGNLPPGKGGPGGAGGGGGSGGGGGDGTAAGGLPYSLQNALLEAQATPGTGDDVKKLNDELAYLDNGLAKKGLSGAERNQLLTEKANVLSQLQQIASTAASAKKQAAAAAAAKQRKHFTTLATLPPALVKRLADAERKGAPETTILGILAAEQRALAGQEKQLEREHAPGSYEARVAKERKAIDDQTQRVIVKARKARIAKLDAVPTGLKLEEANALANNASQERMLAIYEKEKRTLDRQLKTLQSINATQAEKLKNREAAAAIEKKITAITKTQAGLGAALERELLTAFSGLYGGASNVFTQGPGGDRTPGSNPGTSVVVNQHFPHPPTVDGHREAIYARHAARSAFDG